MNIELIGKQLADLQSIVGEWETGAEISALDREVALDKIKALYDELRFADKTIFGTLSAQTQPEEEPEEPEIEVELTYYEGDEEEEEEQEEQEEQEEEPIISISLDDIIIVDEPQTPEQEEQQEETPQEKESPIPPTATSSSLFDLDSIPTRPKSRRSAILSLYSDGVPPQTPPAPQPAVEEVVEMTIKEEEQKEEEEYTIEEMFVDDEPEVTAEEQTPPTIAETLSSPTPTIADMFVAESTSLSESTPPSSSINDHYIMAQELFGGDMKACEKMLSQLDNFDDFDDSMIYIVENYNWNPDCEAAKLVVKLLESKYPLN